ncbi:MAG TPA: hypothetical protein VFI97_01020 [Arthrobacter sp.]|nr:hypothetical protein [Arthrobacter sp.]
MAWWFWILLWVALVALSLLFFGILGLKLFRSFTAVLAELEAAGTRLGSAGHDVGDGSAAGLRTYDARESLFRSRREAKLYYLSSKLQRQEQRRLRRMERKRQRGQPQALRDLR